MFDVGSKHVIKVPTAKGQIQTVLSSTTADMDARKNGTVHETNRE